GARSAGCGRFCFQEEEQFCGGFVEYQRGPAASILHQLMKHTPARGTKVTFIVALTLGLIAQARASDLEEDQVISFTPAVVYEAPVIYQAPVLYQMPVVYLAPVYYLAAAEACCCPQPDCFAPSTVFYIGGRGGSYSYSSCGEAGSTVILFGRAQACAQGYRF